MSEPEDNLNADEAERPEWLPEKFENAEALAASYTNLEREYTQTREHVKAMEENYQLLAQQIEQNQQPSPPAVDPQDAQAQLYAMYENDPIGLQALVARQAAAEEVKAAMAAQAQQAAPAAQAQQALVAQYATNEVRARYPDFDAEKERIGEVIKNNPRFANENLWADPATATQALDEAYRLVKADDLLSGKTPVVPGYDPAAAKIAAQTATGGNPRPDSPDALTQAWENIKNAGGGSYSDSR